MIDKLISSKIIQNQRGVDKVVVTPIQPADVKIQPQKKPAWIRVKIPNGAVHSFKAKLRQHHLHTVCEEASCPNINECFSEGTASFMIMGDQCTRRCPFCDVAHGLPSPLDTAEPLNLAKTVADLQLHHVVITSVNRDDLRDGGAAHFVACIQTIRELSPRMSIEILVPDFRGRLNLAMEILSSSLPDVFNHNLETVPRLYKQVRPGANYHCSLELLQRFKVQHPKIMTKSGLMLGLGETITEIVEVMKELRASGCDLLTIGQYLQPSRYHLPVQRYVTPTEFEQLAEQGYIMGFKKVTSGPLVRSSYHADRQLR
ncbi:MAG: lipoyl synthase [Beggiatoa sp. IS2]|nr:MAG: lipoyl synthase [Beggiatoa sp. IS2]